MLLTLHFDQKFINGVNICFVYLFYMESLYQWLLKDYLLVYNKNKLQINSHRVIEYKSTVTWKVFEKYKYNVYVKVRLESLICLSKRIILLIMVMFHNYCNITLKPLGGFTS